ncbi:hypothetical protein BJ875DRAFT_478202 [Amylocarpus encephaloides]|uniref:DUF6594 domain-containing protein n=1 Tax=Amylocarpus encephaloides TaxID=45428 RepID=A0A9P7Y770_9HELO|nr:hypothetical protein BJ875DRAFT_478202 [Amylocarpus encephaloides]
MQSPVSPTSPTQHSESLEDEFRRHWRSSTDDNNLTLHGFRRFKTSHLLSLRFLEEEIAETDHTIYQAGLNSDLDPTSIDRLGLKHSIKDVNPPEIATTITRELILQLRDLLKQYDEALIAFNQIMAMETFSLLDDEKQSNLRTDLSLYEIYNTRLVRVDLGARSKQDPFQRRLHKVLRSFRYWKLAQRSQSNREGLGSFGARHKWSYQNTVLLAEIVGRVIVAAVTGIFLVVPLAILSHQSSKATQLGTVAVFIVTLSILVSVMLKASNLEMMVVSAAYAAVLSVFVSNVPQ